MKKVMAFGTFDLIHPGHYYYLNKAKELGDCLIVVVARDANALKAKGRKPENSEGARLKNVEKMGIADEAILGDEKDSFLPIEKNKPAVIALGYDQKPGGKILKKELRKRGLKAEIIRIDALRPDVYKSSKLRAPE